MAHVFAGLGKKIYLYEDANGSKKHRQVLWGDWLEIDDDRQEENGFVPIIWAKNFPEHREEVWIKKTETVETQPLEIIFVDVGQGDGSVLITPERDENERIIVIDAGEGDHMCRFLNGRFQAYRGFNFEAAVITHSDRDHYFGFKEIFLDHKIGFKRIYHNGLMELPVRGEFEKVGGTTEDNEQGVTFVNRLWQTHDEVVADFADDSEFGRFVFPPVVHAASQNPKIDRFEMLSIAHGTQENERSYMPGFAPSDGRDYTIEVLGPVVEINSNGEPRLRRIGDYNKTKNGHSVLLRLVYNRFSIFFGGDLNKPAEEFLIRKYTARENLPAGPGADYNAVVAKARQRFRSEVMKTCHHGATDVTDIFLDSVNPACFIISSGDQEGHVHPRPDLLGRLGRFGRGASPVLLSTELQRSTREVESPAEVKKLLDLIDELAANPTENRVKEAKERIEQLARNNVDVYGAIYVKTDGDRLITAFKLETESATKKWFYYEYRIDAVGTLTVVD
jgi:beta-lactamase superfamily II metal-dependent hydrolase